VHTGTIVGQLQFPENHTFKIAYLLIVKFEHTV
jgi:hypothetical protein